MKKLLFTALAVFTCVAINAQANFGLTAGYSNNNFKVESESENFTGFNIGAFVDLSVSDSFSIQPELVYTASTFKEDGEKSEYNLFSVNAMAKYHVSDAFSLMAGPQIGFASGDDVDDLDELLGDDFTKMNFQLAFGAAYNITDNIFVQARYGIQLNDHSKASELDSSVNTLSIGAGYKF
jgi:opacity protein-like surface antigen